MPRRASAAHHLRYTGNRPRLFRLNPPRQFQPYPFPRIFAAHHREPTSKNLQSLKNSGGFPSTACPTNCNTQPNTNNPTATKSSRCQKIPAKATGPDKIMIGIPNVCVSRFTGCWCPFEYSAIQLSQLRPPNIFTPPILRRCNLSLLKTAHYAPNPRSASNTFAVVTACPTCRFVCSATCTNIPPKLLVNRLLPTNRADPRFTTQSVFTRTAARATASSNSARLATPVPPLFPPARALRPAPHSALQPPHKSAAGPSSEPCAAAETPATAIPRAGRSTPHRANLRTSAARLPPQAPARAPLRVRQQVSPRASPATKVRPHLAVVPLTRPPLVPSPTSANDREHTF